MQVCVNLVKNLLFEYETLCLPIGMHAIEMILFFIVKVHELVNLESRT